MWVDVVKGIVSGFVAVLILAAFYFSFSYPSLSLLGLLLALIILEAFLLFWFIFRGNGKKVEVDLSRFLFGVIAGSIFWIFLIASILAV
ncbi:hypothetical protein A2Z23_02900 [Candidatus Curtissbacteria bacterium RBG_16_39_7]|uniref:Uncharacterized protein n=1 Tax=Candidatus Curtissbacteria bacterium RBG_16_39_7 TaxID=1797707 RepID=A0A1F5G448_9BACT|nr:MAG: hypothetical protein A2Z23_02900 [Candidatus Curtissbacteria bacterium RBG_16_39_7]